MVWVIQKPPYVIVDPNPHMLKGEGSDKLRLSALTGNGNSSVCLPHSSAKKLSETNQKDTGSTHLQMHSKYCQCYRVVETNQMSSKLHCGVIFGSLAKMKEEHTYPCICLFKYA